MRLVLLGDPVAHSRSPAIHAAALAALGLAGTYEARRVGVEGVAVAVDEIRSGALDGANVTMPLKPDALDAVDEASLEAVRAGAVNTLVLHNGAVRGENTDIGGLRDVWAAARMPDAPVLILGAGGGAGAALVALEGREIFVSARRSEAADRLVGASGVRATPVAWERPVLGAVVINATPLGMSGEPLPGAVLEAAAGLIDLTYGSVRTPAVRWATGRVPAADGIDHLVAQAARSFTLWTGLAAPVATMVAAARS